MEQRARKAGRPPRDATHRLERAHRILDTTADLILRWGYDKTTIEDIARRTGIAKGTIYLHWRTREELFAALLRRERAEMLSEVRRRAEDGPGRLGDLLGLLASELMSRPMMRASVLGDSEVLGKLVHVKRDGEAGDELRTGLGAYLETLAEHGGVRTDLSPADRVTSLVSVLYGFLIVSRMLPRDYRPPDERLAELLAAREMPRETAEEIREAYARLGEDVPVAVRSSATAEDLPGMSFAGQQDTYLNVRGDGLCAAVKRCWASLWTARAIAYRAGNGVPHEDVALAVVVQELVPADAATAEELARLWEEELLPYFVEACQVLEAAGRQGGGSLVWTRDRLRRMVGEIDAETMLTGAGSDGELASLGPIIGLGRLARGEIDREEFARDYGHRGAHEFEVSIARPGEDQGWIDAQLASLSDGRHRADTLFARRREASEAAWRRFERRDPRKAAKTRLRVHRWNGIVRDRETTRSEVIRAFWALRAFVRRAGELTGHGDDLFFLSIQETVAVLRGDERPPAEVAVRRATYERYAALPAYPTLIVGHFDPVRWAASPDRRGDIFDARGSAPVSETVTGFAGAPGVVEGVARVIAGPEDGARLASGEILVTTLTNIGWTPMFPRAAAVVTDMGAPLSHASIVARELGIPAVVGTGNATMRLRDGDRIRVDGERGTVELLSPSYSSPSQRSGPKTS